MDEGYIDPRLFELVPGGMEQVRKNFTFSIGSALLCAVLGGWGCLEEKWDGRVLWVSFRCFVIRFWSLPFNHSRFQY